MRKALFALAAVAAFAGRASAADACRNLNSQETAQCQTLKTSEGEQAAESYGDTRRYVKLALQIANGSEAATKDLARTLKRPATFDKKYILAGEVGAVNTAVKRSLTALAEQMYA